MTLPIINFAYTAQSGWTVEGDPAGFGRGLNDLTIDVDISTATVLRVAIDGDASKIAKIEYDSNLSGTSLWAWVDANSTPHQATTSIVETTNEDLTTHVTVDVSGVMDEDASMFLTYISSYSSSQRVVSNFRVYDADNNILNMSTSIDRFSLPRDDWYDEDGRIYKDILIENFNACESKLLELQKLGNPDIEPPDVSTIEYPDVTLSSDESSIVNLRSFVSICGLANYPLELQVSGKKVLKLTYFDNNCAYHNITNITPSGISTTNKYVYVDTSNNTIKATSSTATAIAGIFIGLYNGSVIQTAFDPLYANLNLMYLLGTIAKKSGQIKPTEHNQEFYYPNDNKRLIGYFASESQFPLSELGEFYYTDIGY